MILDYGNMGFQEEGTKLERFLPKDQHNWFSGKVSKSAKI